MAERASRIVKGHPEGFHEESTEMIGYLAPEVRARRNRIAAFVATAIAIAFILILRKVWIIFTPKDGTGACDLRLPRA